jgi:hypothetical protein
MNEARARRLEEIIQEHTRLSLEFAKLPLNGGNTEDEARRIAKRKKYIKNRIRDLRHERALLYEV